MRLIGYKSVELFICPDCDQQFTEYEDAAWCCVPGDREIEFPETSEVGDLFLHELTGMCFVQSGNGWTCYPHGGVLAFAALQKQD